MTLPRLRWLVLGLLVLAVPFTLFRSVPEGSLAVLQNRVGRPDPALLSPGLHFRIPVWEGIFVYPLTPVRIHAEADARSKEGTEVRLPFEFEATLNEERVLRAHRKGGGP